MEKHKLTYTLNLHPGILAAVLVEQGIFDIADVSIHPDAKATPGHLAEIVDISSPRRGQGVRISVKSQSDARRELVQQLERGSPYLELLSLFEEQVSQAQTEIFLEERSHVLGASDLLADLFDLPDFLTIEQRKAMAVFLPWAATIRADIKLIEGCCSTIIRQAVKINPIAPKKKYLGGTLIGAWVIGHENHVGGFCPSSAPCYRVAIGPVPIAGLPEFIPGSQQRRFIEEALLPTFLPSGSEWGIHILPEENEGTFIVQEGQHATLIGINSHMAS